MAGSWQQQKKSIAQLSMNFKYIIAQACVSYVLRVWHIMPKT
jgi:hypothetical protein